MSTFTFVFLIIVFVTSIIGPALDIRRNLQHLLRAVETENDQNRLNGLITSAVVLGIALAGLIGVILL